MMGILRECGTTDIVNKKKKRGEREPSGYSSIRGDTGDEL